MPTQAEGRRLLVCVASLSRHSHVCRSMSVLTRRGAGAGAGGGAGRHSLFVKGAPESVLARCTHAMLGGGAVVPMVPELRASLLATVGELAGGSEALRCLACAVRHNLPADVSATPPSALAGCLAVLF